MMIAHMRFGLATLLIFVCLMRAAQAQLPPLPPDNTPLFKVGFDDGVVPVVQQPLYQQMANTLTGFNGLPNDRLYYFSAINNNNNCVINSWHGLITNVQANCNGHLVTVQVIPFVKSTVSSLPTCVVTFDYSETYQVNNDGTFQYLASFYTPALAGQIPYMIGF